MGFIEGVTNSLSPFAHFPPCISPPLHSFVQSLCRLQPLLLLRLLLMEGIVWFFIKITGESAQLLPVCVRVRACVRAKKQQLSHTRNGHMVSYKPIHTGIIVAYRRIFYCIHLIVRLQDAMIWSTSMHLIIKLVKSNNTAQMLSALQPYLSVITLLYYHFVYFLDCKSPV